MKTILLMVLFLSLSGCESPTASTGSDEISRIKHRHFVLFDSTITQKPTP
jgi:hypothetical protein